MTQRPLKVENWSSTCITVEPGRPRDQSWERFCFFSAFFFSPSTTDGCIIKCFAFKTKKRVRNGQRLPWSAAQHPGFDMLWNFSSRPSTYLLCRVKKNISSVSFLNFNMSPCDIISWVNNENILVEIKTMCLLAWPLCLMPLLLTHF